jgi:hypothetical protein
MLILETDTRPNHLHLKIANHSPAQQRKFFVLCAELNFNPQQVKERAKKHYGVSCFNELSIEQMNWLIERLQEKQWQQEQQ